MVQLRNNPLSKGAWRIRSVEYKVGLLQLGMIPMGKQQPAHLPLVVIASEKEGIGFVRRLGLRRDASVRLPGLSREQEAGLYHGTQLNLAITGVLEHNMVAATSLVLLRLGHEVPFVVNFGAVGCYQQRHAYSCPTVGDTVLVRKVCRFDVDDNVHWAPPLALSTPDDDLPAVVCVTGSRYSTEYDRTSPYLPVDGQVEDMELYGLAVLLQTLDIPLLSVKLVVNIVSTDGREQMRQNLSLVRQHAESVLLKVLEKHKRLAERGN